MGEVEKMVKQAAEIERQRIAVWLRGMTGRGAAEWRTCADLADRIERCEHWDTRGASNRSSEDG